MPRHYSIQEYLPKIRYRFPICILKSLYFCQGFW